VAADERDAIRVRTNVHKDEEVYLYHLNLPLEEIRTAISRIPASNESTARSA
jgi:hypothetical protein